MLLSVRFGPFEFQLDLFIEPETLPPALDPVARLLCGLFVIAEIKNQKRMCHGLNFGGRNVSCQDRMNRACALRPSPALVNPGRAALCSHRRMLERASQMCSAIRRLLAMIGLLTLVFSGFSTLAETLCAADVPMCCNTDYCPLHHSPSRKSGAAQTNCDAMRIPGQTDCSMRACDSLQTVTVRTTDFAPAATLDIRGPAIAQATPISLTPRLPYVATLPATPPPRA
jgi:hypothetical protein